jgi:hypothetical protein
MDNSIDLTMHHTIEERFIFPILAERMPQFKAEHLESHRGIHEGEYLIYSANFFPPSLVISDDVVQA